MCFSPHLPAFVTIISFVTTKNCFHRGALSRWIRGSTTSACSGGGDTAVSMRCCSCSAGCSSDHAMVDDPLSRATFRSFIIEFGVVSKVARCLMIFAQFLPLRTFYAGLRSNLIGRTRRCAKWRRLRWIPRACATTLRTLILFGAHQSDKNVKSNFLKTNN